MCMLPRFLCDKDRCILCPPAIQEFANCWILVNEGYESIMDGRM